MYTVKNANNEVICFCSRSEDAQAWVTTKLDKTHYTIENEDLSEQHDALQQNEGIEKSLN